MSNYKLKKIITNKITESSIGFNIQEEYGMRYELEKYEDQIKLEYGPQTFRDLQLKVQENREEEVAEWLKKNEFIKPETTEFHEGIVRNQIRKILKETRNSFQGGKPFGRRSDQDYHDAHNTQNEGKGQELADKYVAQLRQEFKNLNDDELDEFRKTLATAFDMNESRDIPGFEGTMDQLDNLYNNEAKYNKESLMKAISRKNDGVITVDRGIEYIIYNPVKGNDSNIESDSGREGHDFWDMWQDDVIFGVDEDGEEHEIRYSDIQSFKESVNENDYPTSAPRVYVLMLGNRHRGAMGPYRVYVDRAAAEAEAAKQEAEGRDTRAFVQDLPFIK